MAQLNHQKAGKELITKVQGYMHAAGETPTIRPPRSVRVLLYPTLLKDMTIRARFSLY